MKLEIGMKITAYGQQTVIADMEGSAGHELIYINPPIVVPGVEYTRDYVHIKEIQSHEP